VAENIFSLLELYVDDQLKGLNAYLVAELIVTWAQVQPRPLYEALNEKFVSTLDHLFETKGVHIRSAVFKARGKLGDEDWVKKQLRRPQKLLGNAVREVEEYFTSLNFLLLAGYILFLSSVTSIVGA